MTKGFFLDPSVNAFSKSVIQNNGPLETTVPSRTLFFLFTKTSREN